MALMQSSTKQYDTLIKDYIAQYGVTQIPTGYCVYEPGWTPTSRKARLLFERHERVRQMYRDLIAHGFDKWEIAKLMQVRESQVRGMVNKIGLIYELKGLGQCRTP